MFLLMLYIFFIYIFFIIIIFFQKVKYKFNLLLEKKNVKFLYFTCVQMENNVNNTINC